MWISSCSLQPVKFDSAVPSGEAPCRSRLLRPLKSQPACKRAAPLFATLKHWISPILMLTTTSFCQTCQEYHSTRGFSCTPLASADCPPRPSKHETISQRILQRQAEPVDLTFSQRCPPSPTSSHLASAVLSLGRGSPVHEDRPL
jgi:hypothetical protein